MKGFRILCAVLAALTVFCCVSATAFAADTTVTLNGFSFTINDDGEAVIYCYDGRSDRVTIPDKLMGAPVTEIADHAFFGLSSVTSVSFDGASSLSRIGDSAFCGCASITSVAIPSSVTTLGFGAFQNCSALSELSLGDGITQIPAQCFYGCASLKDVVIPAGVTSIGSYAFALCDSLETVTVPAEVESIPESAFDGIGRITVRCDHDSYAAVWAAERMFRRHYLDGYLCGDADADGEMTILDATTVQRFLASFEIISFSERSADADRDGQVTILDATAIQRRLAGFEIGSGIGEFIAFSDADPAV